MIVAAAGRNDREPRAGLDDRLPTSSPDSVSTVGGKIIQTLVVFDTSLLDQGVNALKREKPPGRIFERAFGRRSIPAP